MIEKTNMVIFCGLDGSGKTTQAKKLYDHLKSNNIASKYVWLRYPNFFSLPFAGLLRLFGISGYPIPEKKKFQGLDDLSSHSFFTKLWIWSLYHDFKYVCKNKISRPLRQDLFLILDRFVVDTVVELTINTDNMENLENLARQFFTFIPMNSKIIFLDIDPKISYERNHEEDLTTLQNKRIIYQKICELIKVTIIDGTKSIDEIHQEILQECGLVK